MLRKSVTFSQQTEATLLSLSVQHPATPLDVFRCVYRRGAQDADSATHSRHLAGMKRVEAFVYLLENGHPANPSYVYDNDLLTTSEEQSLVVEVSEDHTFSSDEEAILCLTEYLGLGYEAEPAIRASWLRALNHGESPYHRALSVAQYVFESNDADLLPKT